jgi:predicted nuclease of predicted toxin-antitoxin system
LRILLDENLSPSVAYRLSELGFDVVPQRDRGLLGKKDWALFQYCREQDLVLCTNNAPDFRKEHGRCLARGESHPGILVVSDTRADPTYWALRQYLETHSPDSLDNEYVVIPPADPDYVARRCR